MKKKTNVDILDDIDLADIRQRLGAEDENDTSCDNQINEMTAEELVAKKSGWELGDESWGESYVYLYRQLMEQGVKTNPLDYED